MSKVIKHGKYYQTKETAGIPYVKCPECGFEINIDVNYFYVCNVVMCCQCECLFSVEEEDIEH